MALLGLEILSGKKELISLYLIYIGNWIACILAPYAFLGIWVFYIWLIHTLSFQVNGRRLINFSGFSDLRPKRTRTPYLLNLKEWETIWKFFTWEKTSLLSPNECVVCRKHNSMFNVHLILEIFPIPPFTAMPLVR